MRRAGHARTFSPRAARVEPLERRVFLDATPGSVVDSVTSPATGNTYHLLSPTTWEDAEIKSLALGGHLVVVNDAAEQAFLWSTFGPVTGLFWIGINDVAREGRFVWTTGEPPSYTNWFAGEPNNAYPVGEDWGNMWIDYGSQWNDLGPQSDQPPIQFAVAEVRNGPDLFAALSDVPGSLQPGQTISLSGALKNLGNAPAPGPVGIAYYLSADGTIDGSDVLLASTSTAPGDVPFNASVPLALDVTFPQGAKPGTYRILARVDEANALSEADESNNVSATQPFDLGAVLVPVTRTVTGFVRDAQDLPLNGVQVRAGEGPIAFTDYDGAKRKIDRDRVTGDYELPGVLIGHNVTFAGQFGRFVPAAAETSTITATAQDLSGATFVTEVGVDELLIADATRPDGGLPAAGKAALRAVFLNDYSAADDDGTVFLHKDLRNDRHSGRVSARPAKPIAKTARYAAGVRAVTARLASLGFRENADAPLATVGALKKRSPAEAALKLFKDVWFGPPAGASAKAGKSKAAAVVDAATQAALNAADPAGAGPLWGNALPEKWSAADGVADRWIHRTAFAKLGEAGAASSATGFVLLKASPAGGGYAKSHRTGGQVDFRWIDVAGTSQTAGSFWEPLDDFTRADVTLLGGKKLGVPDPAQLGVTWRYVAAYDQANTAETIRALLAAGATVIRFNDPAILLELGAISIAPGPKPTITILRADVRPEAGYDSQVRVGFQFVA